MNRQKLVLFAVVLGLLVAVIPEFFPTGPTSSVNAAGLFESGQFLVGTLATLLAGLLSALTPCVYPLIPITVSVFGARKAESRGKALLLTSSYVVGMGAVFAALGVVAAKSGAAFGAVLGNPFVVGALAIFLLVLAASMFGAFELALPSGLAEKVNNVGGAGLAGAFLMGSVSGFLTAPCTGPVLTGLLTFVAKQGNTALGAALLFVYALGIGIPFFLIGVFTLKLPRGGEWMEWVKSIFGVALVALAIMYLRDAVPALKDGAAYLAAQFGHIPGALIAGALTFVGVLLGAMHLSFKASRGEFAMKALAVLVVVVALLFRTGALNAGPKGELLVKAGLQAPPEHKELVWHARVKSGSLAALDQSLLKAKAEKRPVMIDFYADWCAACKELDRDVYVEPAVVQEADRFLNIKVDGTNEEDDLVALYEKFGVKGLPTVAFVDSSGEILRDPRVTGYLEPKLFVSELRKVR
ncbi:MAG: protein-disulfide reductase DsbD family protein [Myxococcaceae bacterium]